MRAPTANTRSIVIGTLLAALSAGCLIAFTLVAGSADYPTSSRVLAAEPPTIAAPVTLEARTDHADDRSPRVRPNPGADPSAPIVLGTRISNPEASNNAGDRTATSPRRTQKKDGGKKNGGKDATNGTESPIRVAKPIANPPQSKEFHTPRGHAYGHDKGASASGSSDPSASSSSNGNGPPAHAAAGPEHKSSGPPAHAAANGHDDSTAPSQGASANDVSNPSAHASANDVSNPPAHASANDVSNPPAHASANGHAEVSGPPDHAAAIGHDKAAKAKAR